jgi:hypothetical protein
MAIKIGPGRDLRSVMQNIEQSRQAKNDSARVNGSAKVAAGAAVSGGSKAMDGTALNYNFEAGAQRGGEKNYVPASENAKRFGLESATKKADMRSDYSVSSVRSGPTARGGGWQFLAPEDVGEVASQEPPFSLSVELDPKDEPYALVDAATKTVSRELRMQPGLATMVQANVSPGRAYQLLSS